MWDMPTISTICPLFFHVNLYICRYSTPKCMFFEYLLHKVKILPNTEKICFTFFLINCPQNIISLYSQFEYSSLC